MERFLHSNYIKICKGGENMFKKTKKGFSLIELMIVVAIIAILAMILTPSVLTAINKARQKSTMEDIRNVGMAVDNYRTDWLRPVNSQGTIENITSFLDFYGRKIRTLDHWGYALLYTAQADEYSIGSPAKNGQFGGWTPSTGLYAPPTQLSDFEKDLIYSNGIFTYGPKR